jgi:hypothetical protein
LAKRIPAKRAASSGAANPSTAAASASASFAASVQLCSMRFVSRSAASAATRAARASAAAASAAASASRADSAARTAALRSRRLFQRLAERESACLVDALRHRLLRFREVLLVLHELKLRRTVVHDKHRALDRALRQAHLRARGVETLERTREILLRGNRFLAHGGRRVDGVAERSALLVAVRHRGVVKRLCLVQFALSELTKLGALLSVLDAGFS